MKKLSTGLLLVFVILISSCTTFKMSGIQVTKNSINYTVIKNFNIQFWVFEFLGMSGSANLGNATAANMDAAINKKVMEQIEKEGGDAAINVSVDYRVNPLHTLINTSTFGILAPAKAIVQGTIIKYNNNGTNNNN